jgi:anti-anti-sigma factor
MRVAKKRIIAVVGEGRTVIRFGSSGVALPPEVEKALQEIEEVAAKFKRQLLVISLTGVQHLSSVFFGKLAALHERLSGKGIQLRLCSMSPEAENAYKVLNLQKVIPFAPLKRGRSGSDYASRRRRGRVQDCRRLSESLPRPLTVRASRRSTSLPVV